jgi:RNA polymerase sigma-70 factor (ECF subfamily)
MVGVGARSSRVDRPDAADVEAAARGDDAAFERIVRAMQGHVWRYVVHLLGDAALAEDVAQEVFLRVHRQLGTLRDPARFVPWLLAIARNASYDAGRARRRRPLELVGDREIPTTAHSPDPHLTFEVHDALRRLDPDLHEAIVLVCLAGFTYDEAAEVLGTPAGTIKSRVFRARKRLMVLLEMGADHA